MIKYNESKQIANSTTVISDKLTNKVDESINLYKQAIKEQEQAYQYADGPYKDYITLTLRYNNLFLTELGIDRQRLEYIKEGNSVQAVYSMQQEQNTVTEMQKVANEIDTFKSTHPDVKEHRIQY